ncbi:MAG: cupin domain-containing protein [Planctomycetota bacterium]|nr:cupin domain-containing protein [Planctomycetota bacterium]
MSETRDGHSDYMTKVNLAKKFATFDECWVPKVVAQLNGQYVKVVKFKGEYVWHQHEGEDEMFWVIQGSMLIHLRDQTIELNEGEFFVVPKGVEHKPESPELSLVALFEPMETRNTGNVDHDYTIEADDLKRI